MSEISSPSFCSLLFRNHSIIWPYLLGPIFYFSIRAMALAKTSILVLVFISHSDLTSSKPTPARIVAVIGEKVGAFGAYRDGQEIYGRSMQSKERQLVSLENWSHYDLYDHPEAVSMAMDKVATFLEKHLK